MFAGSPIKRIGRSRFARNVAIAIGNAGDAKLLPAARLLAGDADPVVAEAGAWAAGRLEANSNRRGLCEQWPCDGLRTRNPG